MFNLLLVLVFFNFFRYFKIIYLSLFLFKGVMSALCLGIFDCG